MDSILVNELIRLLVFFKTANLIRNRLVARCFRTFSSVCGKRKGGAYDGILSFEFLRLESKLVYRNG